MIKDLIHRRKNTDIQPAKTSAHIEDISSQMNDFLNGFFSPSPFFSWKGEKSSFFSPSFEVAETDKSLEITAELPGMDEKNIDVSIENNVLSIKGEKKEELDEKKKNYHLTERSYGSFQRSFTIGNDFNTDEIKAKFNKGVLHLTMPKLENVKNKTKKITITQ